VPTTSQVEFGTTPGLGATTGINTNLSTEHAVVLRGLTPGTRYFFRVRSLDAAGDVTSSTAAAFLTTPLDRAVAIDAVGATRVTATTAVIEWTSSTSVAQVEYGTTPAYGRSTLLRSFATAEQQLLLSGLRPLTLYHFRVKTWTAVGQLAVSDDFTFTTAPQQTATLLGERTVQPTRDNLALGQVKAFQFAAQASGLASAAPVYIDAGSSATSVHIGLYDDVAGKPGRLLAQAVLARPIAGAWNRASLRPTHLVEGNTYWLAILNPTGGSGALALRGDTGPGSSLLSGPRVHAGLPLSWVSEVAARGGTTSAYVQQIAPAVTVIGPEDGATLSGNVNVSVTVDGDVPVSSVQFFVDEVAVGIDRTAPFTMVWNSTTARTHDLHTFSARATDASGRTGAAAPVAANVDNGAVVSQVAASGITPSSAWVSWATDSASSSEVEFGPTAAYGRTTLLDATLMWQHRQLLAGLQPNTTYHYRVKSRDQRGVLAVSEDRTFTTAPVVAGDLLQP